LKGDCHESSGNARNFYKLFIKKGAQGNPIGVDPSVLFTTAGMHPLVPYLLGERHPQGKRLVDVHYDIPLTIETQVRLLNEAGFSDVKIAKRWDNTGIFVARR